MECEHPLRTAKQWTPSPYPCLCGSPLSVSSAVKMIQEASYRAFYLQVNQTHPTIRSLAAPGIRLLWRAATGQNHQQEAVAIIQKQVCPIHKP
jgi:hypothetical protein